MLDYNTWMVSHLLYTFAHLCLWIAGVIAFVTTPLSFSEPKSNVTLPWAGSAIAMFGAVVISLLFAYINRVQQLCDKGDQDRGLHIKIAFAASMAVHVPLVAADFTIAVAIATKIRHVRFALVTFGILAALAGFIALWTLIADIIYLRGLYARTYPTNTFYMPLLETDEDVQMRHTRGDGR